MSGGSFRKLTLPSNGISGTGCWANDVAAASSATRVMARRFMATSYGAGQYGDRRRADQALSAGPLSQGQIFEQRLGLLQRETRVGDALAVDRGAAGDVILPAVDQMALEHRAEDTAGTGRDLGADRL